MSTLKWRRDLLFNKNKKMFILTELHLHGEKYYVKYKCIIKLKKKFSFKKFQKVPKSKVEFAVLFRQLFT